MKSEIKSYNSKLKVDFQSANFKFKLTKYKIQFQSGKFKSHNRHWTIMKSQLRKTQFSIVGFQFDHPSRPPPLTFSFWVCTGENISRSPLFLLAFMYFHDKVKRGDRPTRLLHSLHMYVCCCFILGHPTYSDSYLFLLTVPSKCTEVMYLLRLLFAFDLCDLLHVSFSRAVCLEYFFLLDIF